MTQEGEKGTKELLTFTEKKQDQTLLVQTKSLYLNNLHKQESELFIEMKLSK